MLEKYFSKDLYKTVTNLEESIKRNEFFDISVVTSTFEKALAKLKWTKKNAPDIFDEYAKKLSNNFIKVASTITKIDPSCSYLLSGRALPTGMKADYSIKLDILMQEINTVFPNLLDKKEIWHHLILKGS